MSVIIKNAKFGTPKINTTNMLFYYDFNNKNSYPGTGNIVYSLNNNNNGTLINNPTFTTEKNGIILDNFNKYIQLPQMYNLGNFTYNVWYRNGTNVLTNRYFLLDMTNTNFNRISITNMFARFTGINKLSFDENGNIFIPTFGLEYFNNLPRFGVMKINNNGIEDANFNANLKAGSAFNVNYIAYDNNNFIYYGGTNCELSKSNATTGNAVITKPISNAGINTSLALTVQFIDIPNGHIYITGDFTIVDNTNKGRLARLNISDLTVDNSFNTNTGFNAIPNEVIKVANKIYVLGDFTSYNGTNVSSFVCLNLDGTLDTSFNTGTAFISSTFNSSIKMLYDESVNKFYIGGKFTTYNGISRGYLARINMDGSLDTSFTPTFNGVVTDMTIANNTIYSVGRFTTVNGQIRNWICALNLDGTLSTNVDVGTGLSNIQNNDTIYKIHSNGNLIYITSNIINETYISNTNTYNGTNFNSIIRLNLDGTVDNTFNVNNGYTRGTYRNESQVLYWNTSNTFASFTNFIFNPGNGNRNSITFFENYYSNRYINYTFVVSGNTYTVYENGVVNITDTLANYSYIKVNAITAPGTLHSAMLYDRALTASEVYNNYQAFRGKYQ